MSLKFAVIGTGFWSSLQIPAWFEVGDVELVALYNRTTEKAKKAAKKYGNPRVYKDPDQLFQNEELDFVDIITEVPGHEKFVLMAAKYKVPVICQKPMSHSYESCKKMVNTCKEAGISFFIHENWRYRAPFIQLKKILDSNPVGKIRRIEFNTRNGGRLAYKNQPFLKQLPHLVITDIGSHMFDLVRLFFGEPYSLYCSGVRTYDDLAGENFMTAILNYNDKVCTMTIGERIDCYVFIDGEKGSLIMKNDYSIIIKKNTVTKRIPAPKVNEYTGASHAKDYIHPDHVDGIVKCNESFYKALKLKVIPPNNAEENLKTMNLVYGACKSIETNEVFSVSSGNL